MPQRDNPPADPWDVEAVSANGQALPEDGPDPFDLDSLRIAEDLRAHLGVQPALLTLPVCRPHREWWFRVHPDPAYRMQTGMLELHEEGELYLVAPALRLELTTESTYSVRLLVTAITKQGTPFLWPVRLPGPDGRATSWTRSALLTVDRAMTRWVRMQADRQLNGYRVLEAHDSQEPTWPSQSFQDLLRIAFRETFITTRDHIVLRRLRGEV